MHRAYATARWYVLDRPAAAVLPETAEAAGMLEVAEALLPDEAPEPGELAEAPLHAAVSRAMPATMTSGPSRNDHVRRSPRRPLA
jgi:hypothetical protein